MSLNLQHKAAGLLVPVFALRRSTDLGIGDTESVCDAIDFCAEHKLRVLQLLPINETGGDHSPYNAISSIALDPIYLSINPAAVPGLTSEIIAKFRQKITLLSGASVNYSLVKPLKQELLFSAFMQFEKKDISTNSPNAEEFLAFQRQESSWLGPYTLFRTLVQEHQGEARWPEWPAAQQNPDTAERWLRESPNRDRLEDYRLFCAYVQWIAFAQWKGVRAYAEEKGVSLMGDIPFGVSRYSADVWAHQNLFDLTWSGGAPPEKFFQGDEFTARWGQNWGIPLYHWKAHEDEEYRWWKQRVKKTVEIFHSFRIDHVLGFFRVYSFPWMPEHNSTYTKLTDDQATLLTGGRLPQFKPRPDEPPSLGEINGQEGEARLKIILEAAGDSIVVAEDLGMVPDYVRPLLQKLKIPGFTIPIFERDEITRDFKPLSTLPPLNLATYATHDHAPIRTHYEELVHWWHGPHGHEGWLEVQRLMQFLGIPAEKPPQEFTDALHATMTRRLLESPCWLAMFMVTDLLGTSQRFNQPGSSSNSNWSERLPVSLAEYARHPGYQTKLEKLKQEVVETGRA